MPEKDLIILTGGAGFIGSCFLWKLNQEGEKNIFVVDHNNSSEKMKNLVGKDFADYFEKDAFLKILNQGGIPNNVKAVFHIGACSSTTETDANYLNQNNFEYSKTLAKWSIDNSIPFFYASSAAAYGDGSLGYSDEDALTLKLSPLNLYGKSKQEFDAWLINNKLADKVVGFRYFNVFGPNEYHKEEMRSLVVKAYQQIRQEGRMSLFKSYRPEYKDGEQKRDFIYVKDVIDLMYEFYRKGTPKGIFNIGTGKARTWNDLARAIFKALEQQPKIEYVEMPASLKDKYQYFTQADLSRLKRAGINFQFTSLENAVADYVKEYLQKDYARLT